MQPVTVQIGYERPPLLDDGERDPYEGVDKALLREVAGFIQRHYPKLWPWIRVRADHSQGICTIWMPRLMGDINRMVLHTAVLDSGVTAFDREIRRGIGELLERYRLARDRTFNADVMREAIGNMPLIGLNNLPVPE